MIANELFRTDLKYFGMNEEDVALNCVQDKVLSEWETIPIHTIQWNL